MKHTITRIILALIVTVAISCSENSPVTPVQNDDAIKVVNGRLSFPDTKSLLETMTKINKMKDPKEIADWQSSHKIASIFSSEVDAATPDSLSLKRFDNGHQVVLNANGEVLIGDTIVWYATDGIKHFVPNGDETQLAKIKSGAIESKITGSYSIGRLTPTEAKGDKSQALYVWSNPTNGAKGPNHQHEFCKFNNCTNRRKFVTELWNTTDYNHYTLYLVAKMEWKGSGDWQPSGELRNIIYNFDYTVSLSDGTYYLAYGPKSGNAQYSTQYNDNLNIFVSDDYACCFSSRSWTINISGQLYQEIVDDPANGWNDYGNPMF
jgi:hypothetical protein